MTENVSRSTTQFSVVRIGPNQYQRQSQGDRLFVTQILNTELNRKRCIHKEKLRITNGQNKKIRDQICNGALSVSGKS